MITPISQVVTDLEAVDRDTRQSRAHRSNYILQLIEADKGGIRCWGGPLADESINEVRMAYIHGLWLATVLMSLAFIEHEVGARLVAIGCHGGKLTELKKILEAAKERGILTTAEFNTFDDLRDNRNSYTHFRSFSKRYSFAETDDRRQDDKFKALYSAIERMETDAQRAIEGVESFFGREWRMESKAESVEEL